jgi:hypothetical protein
MTKMSQVEKFLSLLTKRTNDKKVLWDETDYEDTYESLFGDTVLRLTPYRPPHALSALTGSIARVTKESSSKSHVLEISSKNGIVEIIGTKSRFGDPNLVAGSAILYGLEDAELDREVAPAIKRLHTAVQRQLDIPSALIASLIEELEKE